MSCNDDAAGGVDDPICGQHIGGGAYFGGPPVKPVGRHVQVKQDMLELPNGGFRREEANDVKSEGGRKLEARQHQNLLAQPAIFVKLTAFVGAQAVLDLQPLQPLDLRSQTSDASYGVVVGDCHHIQPALLALIQPVEPGRARLFPVGRCHGVQVQINCPPLALGLATISL